MKGKEKQLRNKSYLLYIQSSEINIEASFKPFFLKAISYANILVLFCRELKITSVVCKKKYCLYCLI